MSTCNRKGHKFLDERMIVAEERSTVFNRKYFGLDVIYGRIFSHPKQFGNERRHALVMFFARVLMAGPENLKNSLFAGRCRLAKYVVRWAEVTEVVLNNDLAEHAFDFRITMSVPAVHPAARNNFWHQNWLK